MLPHSSESLYPAWLGRKEIIPVQVARNPAYFGLSEKFVPRNITFTIRYWQTSLKKKHVISAQLYFDNFYRPDFCVKSAMDWYNPDSIYLRKVVETSTGNTLPQP